MLVDRSGMKKAVLFLVGLHLVLLAAYTFPDAWVPTRLRYWSQAYARVLFHQDWRLFAPDPPACGCSLEFYTSDSRGWLRVEDLHDHVVWSRMCANACRFAEASALPGDTIARVPEALAGSLHGLLGTSPSRTDAQWRIHQHGAADWYIVLDLQTRR